MERVLEDCEIKIPPNIKVLQVEPASIISRKLGIDPNNNVEVIEVLQEYAPPNMYYKGLGGLNHLAGFITNYMLNTRILDFSKISEALYFPPNMINTLDQLEIINLSGGNLNKSHDKLFLAWLMIKGNCVGLKTDNAKLTDFQKSIKESDEPDLEQILANLDPDLAKFEEKEFKFCTYRQAMKALDQNLTLIKSDPNALESEQNLSIHLNQYLVKAILALPPEHVFAVSIPFVSHSKKTLYSLLRSEEISNVEIKSLNTREGQFSDFVHNMVLAMIFYTYVENSKSKALKEVIKKGPFFETVGSFVSNEDFLKYIIWLMEESQTSNEQAAQEPNNIDDSNLNLLGEQLKNMQLDHS